MLTVLCVSSVQRGINYRQLRLPAFAPDTIRISNATASHVSPAIYRIDEPRQCLDTVKFQDR